MKNRLFSSLALLLLASCGEHSGQDIIKFTGEYRYYHGIAEFFDCKERVKYYVAEAGVDTDLKEAYLAQEVAEDDDVYMQLTGYLKEEEEQKMPDIDPATLFVAVDLLTIDKSRGCERPVRQGF